MNFALFSRHATRVRLELFDHPDDAVPARVIDLDAAHNRTGDVWHVWVKGIGTGQLYAYRVEGPYEPREGHRFNVHKLLLDPCASAISRLPPWDFALARGYDPSALEDLAPSQLDNARSMPKCIFLNEPFDWQGDQPPRHPWSKTLVTRRRARAGGSRIRRDAAGLYLLEEHPGEEAPYRAALTRRCKVFCGSSEADEPVGLMLWMSRKPCKRLTKSGSLAAFAASADAPVTGEVLEGGERSLRAPSEDEGTRGRYRSPPPCRETRLAASAPGKDCSIRDHAAECGVELVEEHQRHVVRGQNAMLHVMKGVVQRVNRRETATD